MSELKPTPGQKHIHLDPVGGVAGDMFIAAVLAAFPDLQDGMVEAIRAAGLPAAIGIHLDPHRDHALTGLRFAIKEADGRASHQHRHRPFSDIRRQLQHSGLATKVKEQAIAIFTLLAQVEARVHGMSVEDVSFYELGEWDSIADIVGAAFLITHLQATWSVGPPGAIVGVPTSVGYGAAEGGRTALKAMLASCASGLAVTNIDNGYGGACAALRILGAIRRHSQP